MEAKQVDLNMFEYGNVILPQDLDQLRLVAAKQPESNHFMVISMKLFYQLVKKSIALESIMTAVEKKEDVSHGPTEKA
jgi:hypothetical protein